MDGGLCSLYPCVEMVCIVGHSIQQALDQNSLRNHIMIESAVQFCHDYVQLVHSAPVCMWICVCSAKKQWLVQRMEDRQQPTRQQQLAILRGLIDADAFEKFLASKFPASKVMTMCNSALQ